MSTTFNTLYQVDAKGKQRYWKVDIIDESGKIYIVKEYGSVGGKPIVNKKEISVCKSKKTLYDQAVLEAGSDWSKKVKEGYVSSNDNSLLNVLNDKGDNCEEEDDTSVKSGSVPSCKEGIVRSFGPMLAETFDPKIKNLTFPVICQPKLDGVRMLTHYIDNSIELKSRNNSTLNHISHLLTTLKSIYGCINNGDKLILDGEIYSDNIPFKKLAGLVNRSSEKSYMKIPIEQRDCIQYHIYDCYFVDYPTMPFIERYKFLITLFSSIINNNPSLSIYIKLVQSIEIDSYDKIIEQNFKFVETGFEGTMIRKISGIYKPKGRSRDLLKYKLFVDSEFKIVGGKSGTGTFEGCLIYLLETPSGNRFSCTSEGTISEKKSAYIEYMKSPDKFIGLEYTIKYQSIDPETGIPRFPTGKGIRYDLQ